MTKNYFYHGYQHPIWPKTDKNGVYFGPFRPKIDPNMVSYKITFTKKFVFMPIFHLFTQMRIILNHHVWDHFSTQQNLNKRIWLFWAPVQNYEKHCFCFWVHWVVIHYHTLPMNAILHQFKDITMPDAFWLDVQPKNIITDKQSLTNKRLLRSIIYANLNQFCLVFP